MIRRDFLRRLTLTAAGLLVADDIADLVLTPERRFWPGADFGPYGRPATFDYDAVQAVMRRNLDYLRGIRWLAEQRRWALVR